MLEEPLSCAGAKRSQVTIRFFHFGVISRNHCTNWLHGSLECYARFYRAFSELVFGVFSGAAEANSEIPFSRNREWHGAIQKGLS